MHSIRHKQKGTTDVTNHIYVLKADKNRANIRETPTTFASSSRGFGVSKITFTRSWKRSNLSESGGTGTPTSATTS